MKYTTHEAAAKIIAHYGVPHQLVKLCEECGELIQQAVKCYDSGSPYTADFVEELADVRVMLLQFEAVLGQSAYWADLYAGTVQAKIDRQLARIESEAHDDIRRAESI